MLQGLGEALLLLFQHAHYVVAGGGQLRVGLPHLLYERVHQAVEERARQPQPAAVAHRAADYAAQHVTAPLVGGDHAVRNQKCTGADVIRYHPQ